MKKNFVAVFLTIVMWNLIGLNWYLPGFSSPKLSSSPLNEYTLCVKDRVISIKGLVGFVMSLCFPSYSGFLSVIFRIMSRIFTIIYKPSSVTHCMYFKLKPNTHTCNKNFTKQYYPYCIRHSSFHIIFNEIK